MHRGNREEHRKYVMYDCTLKVISNWDINIVIVVDVPHKYLAIEFTFTEIIK
jgi:hypothetical protein